MFWLIWITIIVLVPVGAGVHVWWNLHRTSRAEATVYLMGRCNLLHSAQSHTL